MVAILADGTAILAGIGGLAGLAALRRPDRPRGAAALRPVPLQLLEPGFLRRAGTPRSDAAAATGRSAHPTLSFERCAGNCLGVGSYGDAAQLAAMAERQGDRLLGRERPLCAARDGA